LPPVRDFIHVLLNAGANADGTDSENCTALIRLASKHLFPNEISIPLMKTLIEAGANVNHRALSGVTPLLIAVLSENPPAANLLTGAGADVNCVCERGTLLDIVEEDIVLSKGQQSTLRQCQEVRKILRSCGAKRTSRNSAADSSTSPAACCS
jgi:ankyrin repeat protein